MEVAISRQSQIDNEFYRNFLRIAVPVALQCLFAASLNLVDNIMVGQLGAISIAGVSLANQFCFIIQVLLLGTSGAASIFISQFWGSKSIDNVKRVLGLGLIIGLITSLLFFIAAVSMPDKILHIYTSDTRLISSGSGFLRIISFSFMMSAVSLCFAAALRSTGSIVLPMVTGIIALGINTGLNYTLIFGHFGFRSYGVKGAAIATVIARAVELSILLIFTYSRKKVVAARINELLDISVDFVKRFAKTSSAVIFKDIIWVLGTSAYMIFYAKIGTEAVASLNIVSTVRQLGYVFFVGISNACLIMVGNQIGANCYDTAIRYAKKFLKITLLLGIVIGGMILLSRHLILSPYNVSASVIKSAYDILLVFGIGLFMEVFNMVAVVGVMRSGGDIKFCIVMDIIAVWVIGLPLVILGSIVFKLPVVWVFLLVFLQEVFKFIVCNKRIHSKKWCKNIVNDIT